MAARGRSPSAHRAPPFTMLSGVVDGEGPQPQAQPTVFRCAGGIRSPRDPRINNQASSILAQRTLALSAGAPNLTESLMMSAGLFREGLGQWWRKKRPDSIVRVVMQSIANTYPSPFKLHQWGIKPTPFCTSCPAWKEL
eukprot:890710-Rhodomonas_salina.1